MLLKIWLNPKFLITLHPQNTIGWWCNGNTTGFGSVIPGSNPSHPTKESPSSWTSALGDFFYDSIPPTIFPCKRHVNDFPKLVFTESCDRFWAFFSYLSRIAGVVASKYCFFPSYLAVGPLFFLSLQRWMYDITKITIKWVKLIWFLTKIPKLWLSLF